MFSKRFEIGLHFTGSSEMHGLHENEVAIQNMFIQQYLRDFWFAIGYKDC